jgi:hypothetical protein
MKKALLLIVILAGVVILACNKTTTLPTHATSTVFSANSKITHSKDSIRNSGDTVIFSAQGNISDTSRKYTISANLLSVDTTAQTNLVAANYVKTITVKFDTTGMAKSGLYHWTSSLPMYYPPIASKSKFKTTATFTYGLTLSSQTGTQTGTDSKMIYVK